MSVPWKPEPFLVIAARDMSRKERFRYAEIKERSAKDTSV